MSHIRLQALEAFVTALTGLNTTGANVFLGRISPLMRNEVPGLVIRGGGERIDVNDLTRPRTQERFYQVDVLVHVHETDDYEQALNTVLLEVEPAIAAASVAASFGAKAITLRHVEAPVKVQGEKTYVQAAMNCEVFYLTAENAPDQAL